MISRLTIKNIALIQDVSLELKRGLNILSGETGAGKSIIIDSLSFVLGDRADRSLIRYGETTARVEVVFDNIDSFDTVRNQLEDIGIDCEDETVIVTRSMTSEKSECRINGRTVNVATLRNIVALLVDIHSQNEHQSLLKVSNHIKLLDAFSPKIAQFFEIYSEKFNEYRSICSQLEAFFSQEDRERKLDILNYQIEEIERVAWREGEEDSLNSDKNRFYNAQKIGDALNTASQYIDGYGTGGIFYLKKAYSELNSILKFYPELTEIVERLDSAVIEIEDISAELDARKNGEYEGINIDAVERRLDEIRLIKKKYGKTAEEVAQFLEKAVQERDFLSEASDSVLKLEKRRAECEAELLSVAKALHDIRSATAEEFSHLIQENLTELGMKNAKFKTDVRLAEDILSGLTQSGADSVEFMLSPNAGEPLKPLAKIASGGEMSRFMLALKKVIAEIDGIGTLIFDEIDTGISGVIAKVVACKLYDIARKRQVIAITHLPQLASMADTNFLIEKGAVGEKTVTSVTELDEKQVHEEIMRLSGSVENSEVGLAGAIELKNWSNQYKSR